MSSQAALTGSMVGQELADPPFDPTLVEELLRQFARAIRMHQLYLPNNPMYQRAIEAVQSAFAPVWAVADELVLDVTESEFRWGGRVVARETSKSESLPWLFYKDGIRQLTLRRGVEEHELGVLLDTLRRVRQASDEQDDLLTLLWEQDFVFVRYSYVSLGLDAAATLGPSPRTTSEQPLERLQFDAAAEPQPAVIKLEDFDAALYFLDEGEIEYLRSEIAAEYRADPRGNALSILFDVFELQAADSVRREIIEVLEGFLPHLLAANAFSAVALIFREARLLAERAPELSPAHRARLEALGECLSAPGILSQVLQALEESVTAPPQEELDALFQELRPGTLATVLGWLRRAENAHVRTSLERAAAHLISTNTAELVKLIGSEDPTLSHEAIRRAGELRTIAAVVPLGRALGRTEAGLRIAAAQALAAIGSTGALQLLEQALSDSERDVRVVAARAVAARAHHAAFPRVAARVSGKGLRDADLTEKMAFFEAFGVLAGAEGVSQLDALLNGRGFFSRREDNEIRACAAIALGKIGDDSALDALRRAAGDRDVVVRNAVNRALRGGSA